MGDSPESQNESITGKLKNTYLFNIFSSDELDIITSFCQKKQFPYGKVIFEEGDHPQSMYIIISGQVSVSQSLPGKKYSPLALLQEGDFFGEMSLLDGFPRSATARAHDDCLILEMGGQDFDRLMEEQKDIGLKWLWTFCRIMSSRLRDTNEKLKQLQQTMVKAGLNPDEEGMFPLIS